MRVSADMPDDVLVLHDALQQIRDTFGTPIARKSPITNHQSPIILHLKNCGTALRFLQVHLAKCYPGEPITLTGDPRLMERDGKPTTQTTSALILHGEPIPVTPDESPYITMSRRMAKSYSAAVLQQRGLTGVAGLTTQWSAERCWSSASYWYEYIAIHGGELLLEGLQSDSLQGDRLVADIYAKYFGVETTFTAEGAFLQAHSAGPTVSEANGLTAQRSYNEVVIDFVNIPDLYPAVALTCERLGIPLHATGTERLRYKESDRLEAVRLHEVRNDHRMAMALMAADFPVSIDEQVCIAKSYPQFVKQMSTYLASSHGKKTAKSRQRDGNDNQGQTKVGSMSVSHITPIRGVNDDNLGKKHALSKLIHASTADYLWLHDDDVVLPPILQSEGRSYSNAVLQCNGLTAEGGQTADLLILPLKMESEQSKPSILERLQIAEYAAIQELTMRTAKRGRAVMCSGANLIVKREVWLACEPDLHPEIPSGDDMFLLEAAKRRGYKIGVIDEPDYTAIVRPLTSWKSFFRQRMRWAGKAPHYTDPDIRRCGTLIILANILQLLCPPILLIKFPIEYSLIRSREKSYTLHPTPYTVHPTPYTKKPRTPWYVALLLEILYPFYLLISLLGGIFSRRAW